MLSPPPLCAAVPLEITQLLIVSHRKTRPGIRYRLTDRFTPWWDQLENRAVFQWFFRMVEQAFETYAIDSSVKRIPEQLRNALDA